jgi:hypothetical protein
MSARRFRFVILPAVWIVFGILTTIQGYVFSAQESEPVTLGVAALRQLPIWPTWALFTPLVLWLGERVPIARHRWVPAVAFHVAGGLVIAAAHSALAMALYGVLFPDTFATEMYGEMFVGFLVARVHFSVFTYWAILGTGYAFTYYEELRRRQIVASQLEAQLAHAQLQALRMQLHPHFLFNTLHAISVLVEEHPSAAKRMITKLGDLLRLSMETSGVQEVSLREELEFLRLYLEIEQIRFHDRLSVRYEIPDDALAARVPIFILQPVVENAIKHGIAQRAGAGTIEIGAARANGRLRLWVWNDGGAALRPDGSPWRDGIGLGTTRARLDHLYGPNGVIDVQSDAGAVRVQVSLPWATRPSDQGERESSHA